MFDQATVAAALVPAPYFAAKSESFCRLPAQGCETDALLVIRHCRSRPWPAAVCPQNFATSPPHAVVASLNVSAANFRFFAAGSLVCDGDRYMTVYDIRASAKVKGLFFDVRISSGGLRSDAEGVSPNSARYAIAKRPSSKKPFSVAISVTVAAPDQDERAVRQMHPTKPEISDGTHT